MAPALPLVVLTGAEGKIGSGFGEEYLARYASRYRLRPAVREDAPFDDPRFHDVARFRLEDLDSTRRAVTGADVVVHLAANPDFTATFDDLVGPNLVGVYHVFEAARLEGCRRVVFASSVHAIMAHPAGPGAAPDRDARPDTIYGAAKLFGEGLCSAYAHAHGMSCIAVRIGGYVSDGSLEDAARRRPEDRGILVSRRDLCRLLHLCVTAPPEVTYAVVQGMSRVPGQDAALSHAERTVGYRPEDSLP